MIVVALVSLSLCSALVGFIGGCHFMARIAAKRMAEIVTAYEQAALAVATQQVLIARDSRKAQA